MGTIDTIRSHIVSFDNSRHVPSRRSAGAFLRHVVAFLAQRAQKRRSRAILLTLTDDELRDIGITRSEAENEAGKSFFWD